MAFLSSREMLDIVININCYTPTRNESFNPIYPLGRKSFSFVVLKRERVNFIIRLFKIILISGTESSRVSCATSSLKITSLAMCSCSRALLKRGLLQPQSARAVSASFFLRTVCADPVCVLAQASCTTSMNPSVRSQWSSNLNAAFLGIVTCLVSIIGVWSDTPVDRA